MFDKNTSVFVEYCVDCSLHAWCTKHDEDKYKQFFKNVKEAVESEFEDIQVYGNRSPLNGRQRNPTLGAFEVIFSKLKTGLWPTRDVIFERMQLVANGQTSNDEIIWPYQEKKQSNSQSRRTLSTDPTVRRRLASKHHINGTDYDTEKSTIQDFDQRNMRDFSTIEARRGSQGKMISLPSVNKGMFREAPSSLKANIVEARSNSLGRQPLDYEMAIRTNYEQYRTMTIDREYPSKDSITQTGESLKMSNMRVEPRANVVYPNQDRRHSDVPPASKKNSLLRDDSTESIEKGKGQMKKSPLMEQYQDDLERMYGEPAKPKKYSDSESYQVLKTDESEHTGSHPVIVAHVHNLHKIWPNGQQHYSQMAYNSNNPKPNTIIKLNTVGQTLHPTTQFSQKQLKNSESPYRSKLPETSDNNNEKSMRLSSSPPSFKEAQIAHQAQKLGNILFPFQKVSHIKVPKEGVSKKKITLEGDKEKDCKFTIQTNMVDILSMTTYEIVVPKGALFKIPLKFVSKGEDKTRGCLIYVFKDDKPWLKILVEISTI